mmetsp:Transcript_10520/g.12005  ORF Transcript_10520/g.12005 Transcript_10520/m.12005 type:complete len:122 (-) Transcript_10520:694-1059(-)
MDNLAFNGQIGEAEAAAQTANCCNLFSWFFAWWVIFSPLILWYKAWINGVYVRLGTGPWVVSANTQTFNCGYWCTGVIQNSWLYVVGLNINILQVFYKYEYYVLHVVCVQVAFESYFKYLF